MSQTTMTIRVDNNLKHLFDQLCDEFGLSNTAALTIFMKAVVRERRIPFEIKVPSEQEVRTQAMDAFRNMQMNAASAGMQNYSLDEINQIIDETRNA